MDFLNPVINGFAVVLEPTNLLYCLIGVVIGMLIGVLPGLGPAATIAILLPLTYNVEPVTAIIMLAGIFYGAQYGGTITSVLLSCPAKHHRWSRSSTATRWPSRAGPAPRSAWPPSAPSSAAPPPSSA